MNSLSIIEARKQLTSLPEQLELEPQQGAITITRRGRPVLAILSWEFYDSLVETLEIIGDEAQMQALKQGIEEIKQGKTIPWAEAKQQLTSPMQGE